MADRFIVQDKRGSYDLSLVIDTYTGNAVYRAQYDDCLVFAESRNSGYREEFEAWVGMAKALIVGILRVHPAPWSIHPTPFGADIKSEDGMFLIASCQNMNQASRLCELARELNPEATPV